MKYAAFLGVLFVSLASATPRGSPYGSPYTIVKRDGGDDDYNTTCGVTAWQTWSLGKLSKHIKDMADESDGMTFWKDDKNNDRVVDENGCSEYKEACACGNTVWLCAYGDKDPGLSQTTLSKFVGASMTDCGIQFGNTDGKDYDGMFGIKIEKPGYELHVAGGAKSCKC